MPRQVTWKLRLPLSDERTALMVRTTIAALQSDPNVVELQVRREEGAEDLWIELKFQPNTSAPANPTLRHLAVTYDAWVTSEDAPDSPGGSTYIAPPTLRDRLGRRVMQVPPIPRPEGYAPEALPETRRPRPQLPTWHDRLLEEGDD